MVLGWPVNSRVSVLDQGQIHGYVGKSSDCAALKGDCSIYTSRSEEWSMGADFYVFLLPFFKGGYGMDEENCLAFVSYYPAVNITSCGSTINTRKFLEVTDYIPVS